MTNPVCVVAGAGPGIGMAVARRFAEAGYAIALIGRNQSSLDAFADALSHGGHSARGFAADLGDGEQIAAAFEELRAWNGNLEILVYNAALLDADDAPRVTSRDMVRAMTVNFYGAIDCVNEVLPTMRKGQRGTILFTGGGLSIEPYPNWTALAAGKSALRSYGISLHKALKPENIHVCVIAVCGIVEPGGPFDPDLIANEYWSVHEESLTSEWRRELIYQPQGTDPDYNAPKADRD